MSELKDTEDHQWIRLEEDNTAVVGITDYAQEQLGDVVYVEMPAIGRELGKDDEAALVESVKAAGEVKMPLTGTVLSVNENLEDEPELVNADPEGDGRQRSRLLPQDRREFRLLPGVVLMAPAEMAKASGLLVDRPAQVQRLDDLSRLQREVLAN